MLALLLRAAATTLRSRTTPVIVVVVVVVGLKDALPQFLLPPVDIRVQLVAVFANRELLVVVDGNVDTASAHRLVLRVMELSHVGVSQSLFCRQTSVRVEMQKVAD